MPVKSNRRTRGRLSPKRLFAKWVTGIRGFPPILEGAETGDNSTGAWMPGSPKALRWARQALRVCVLK